MTDFFKENKSKFLITLAVIITLIFLHSFKIITPVENILISALKPVQIGISKFAQNFSNFFQGLAKIGDLETENNELKSQIEELILENNNLKTIFEENKITNPQVKFLEEKNYEYSLARVISKGVDPTFKIITINQGESEGFKSNMPVISNEGFLVGKLIKVDKNRSQVMLINDTRSTTAAQIQNDKGTQGVIKGQFGLSIKMEMIPKEDEIEENQYVITSGLENFIPKGLVIGQIDSISKKPGDFFQTALISPVASLEQLQIVSVIKNF